MHTGFWKQFDWILLMSAVLLTLFGIVSMISTTATETAPISRIVLAQSIFMLLGIALAIGLSVTEYRSIQSFAPILYGGILIALVLVLLFGEVRNGSKAWFNLGIVSFQPAEVAKLCLILVLARFFAKNAVHDLGSIVKSLIFVAPIAVLIFLQPDIGTLLSVGAIWFIMVISLQLRMRQRLFVIGTAVGLVAVAVTAGLLFLPKDNFQVQRMLVYPEHLFLSNTYHTGIGYQVDQSLIAVGSGGITGKGLGHGSQSQYGFLPAQTTDFIFASIAEEIGFLGSLILLALIIILLLRILHSARVSRDRFGRYLSIGICGMILFHVVENIGMNIGLLPVTGIPLSFVSYGGSHLLTVYASIGLIESIVIRSKGVA